MAAMKMRQSLAQLEREFRDEVQHESNRRERLRRQAAHRSRLRQAARVRKAGSVRYWVLVLTLITTALVVTAAMFACLYYLLK